MQFQLYTAFFLICMTASVSAAPTPSVNVELPVRENMVRHAELEVARMCEHDGCNWFRLGILSPNSSMASMSNLSRSITTLIHYIFGIKHHLLRFLRALSPGFRTVRTPPSLLSQFSLSKLNIYIYPQARNTLDFLLEIRGTRSLFCLHSHNYPKSLPIRRL